MHGWSKVRNEVVKVTLIGVMISVAHEAKWNSTNAVLSLSTCLL